MGPLALLEALWAKDVLVTRSGDALKIQGANRLTHRERELVAEHKPALLLLCDAIAWRAEAMFAQLKPGKTFPFLVAKRVPAQPGHCLSCGEPSATRRCPLCARAAHLVTAEAMRVRPGSPAPSGPPSGEPNPEE